MAKYYAYRGFNEYDGLAGYAESKEQAQAKIQETIDITDKGNIVCKPYDIHEFDSEEAYYTSRLYTDICRKTGTLI